MNRDGIVKRVEDKLTSGVEASNDTFILVAASIYLHQQVHYDTIENQARLTTSNNNVEL